MTRSRAADDFATIRARMEELRRERTDTRGVPHNPRSFGEGRAEPPRRPETQERFEHENWQLTRRR